MSIHRLAEYEKTYAAHLTDVDDRTVRLTLRMSVPLQGKRTVTIHTTLATPALEMKRALLRQEPATGALVSGPDALVFRCADSDAPLADTDTLWDRGYDHPPLVLVSGFAREYFLRLHGTDERHCVAWHPHLTATDVLRAVVARVQPADIRRVRVVLLMPPDTDAVAAAVEGADPSPPRRLRRGMIDCSALLRDAAPAADERNPLRRVVLPTSNCFVCARAAALAPSTSVADLRRLRAQHRAAHIRRRVAEVGRTGYDLSALDAAALADPDALLRAMPREVHFVRSQNGAARLFRVAVAPERDAQVTLADIGAVVSAYCERRGELLSKEHALDMHAAKDPEGVANMAAVAVGPAVVARLLSGDDGAAEEDSDQLADLALPFDDSDEEISPQGEHRYYTHDVFPDTPMPPPRWVREPEEDETERELSESQRDRRRDAEAVAQLERFIRQYMVRPVRLSFNPPSVAALEAERTPVFIDKDEDYSVRSVVDMGLLPGSEMLVEHFDPHEARWSDEVAAEVEAGWVGADSGEPRQLLPLRTERGRELHLLVPPSACTAGDLLRLIFCITGDLPQFAAVRCHERFVPWDRVVARGPRLPAADISVAHRPRPWLLEAPDVVPSLVDRAGVTHLRTPPHAY